jgi:branched-chain amino acid transport system substrate-binding protein
MMINQWFLATISALSIIGTNAFAQSQPPYDIGVIAPTTGPLTVIGLRQLYTFQWWERETNAKGGIKGREVRLLHCNDEGSPEKAVTCARDLLGKKVLLLINATVTGPVRATMPLVKDGPVMLVASPNIAPTADTNIFQTSPTDVALTQAIADFLKKNNSNQLGIVAATDASGEVVVDSAKAVFPGAGINYNLARIDLRATDASIQLASVAKPDVKLIYSAYSGGGAATLVKSYSNLGLTQALLVGYANISDVFVAMIKNDLPSRLLGIGLRGNSPDLVPAGAGRDRLLHFATSFREWKNEQIDQLNIAALPIADTVDQVLRNVPDPANATMVKAYLETTPIQSYETIRFSPQSHVGLSAESVAVLELKGDRWVAAGPLK